MKKLFLLLTLMLAFSCNDGNLDIASFEFEEKVNVCGDINITMYRLSSSGHKEALIVTLTDKQIKNDDTPILPVSVSEKGSYTVTDRVFESEVNSSYFCTVVPPVEPKVIKNWKGISGTIAVQNNKVFDEDGVTVIAYEHIIVLKDVVLKSGDESLIFNDTYLFGVFQTSVN
ncbi:MAG: hypothetical protein J7K34_07140 [Flavobacteriaceae bacterium]|nr:hypothetical protein [Flavobacteriaceae bacterium]